MRFKNTILFIGLTLTMGACATYTLPVNSLTEQLQEAKSNTKQINTKLNGPTVMGNFSYQMNGVDTLKVYNSKGQIVKIKNAPSIEMQLTLKNGKIRTYYFDSVTLTNDSIKGCYSRFLNRYSTIAIKDIKSIGVQNAKKGFNYAK
jgi:hypothetical protein